MFKIVATIYFGMMIAAMGISYANAAEPIKVAIIDTGLNLEDARFKSRLCPGDKHWNFVHNNNILKDEDGHGTHIAGLITKYAENVNYCLLIYKYYDEAAPGNLNLRNSVSALLKAVGDGASIVNLSYYGPEFSEVEYNIMRNNPKVTFVTCAGNDGKILAGDTCSYPACYRLPNVIVVGSKHDGKRAETSNWGGKVNAWEDGTGAYSTLPDGKTGYMSGTSMSTAIHTGKLVNQRGRK